MKLDLLQYENKNDIKFAYQNECSGYGWIYTSASRVPKSFYLIYFKRFNS